MDITEFKRLVAGYMNRDESALVTTDAAGGSTDLIVNAANSAKLFAQRKQLFEWARAPLQFSVHPTAGVNYGVGRIYGTDLLVGVRHLLRAAVLVNGQLVPCDLVGGETAIQDARRQSEFVNTPVQHFNQCAPGRPRVVLNGTIMYVQGIESSSNITVVCDAYYWLTPYQLKPTPTAVTWPGKEDFFLTYCSDWMLYRSIQELNLFLKEDQRIAVSSALINEAWETIRTWNANLATSQDDLSLD